MSKKPKPSPAKSGLTVHSVSYVNLPDVMVVLVPRKYHDELIEALNNSDIAFGSDRVLETCVSVETFLSILQTVLPPSAFRQVSKNLKTFDGYRINVGADL